MFGGEHGFVGPAGGAFLDTGVAGVPRHGAVGVVVADRSVDAAAGHRIAATRAFERAQVIADRTIDPMKAGVGVVLVARIGVLPNRLGLPLLELVVNARGDGAHPIAVQRCRKCRAIAGAFAGAGARQGGAVRVPRRPAGVSVAPILPGRGDAIFRWPEIGGAIAVRPADGGPGGRGGGCALGASALNMGAIRRAAVINADILNPVAPQQHADIHGVGIGHKAIADIGPRRLGGLQRVVKGHDRRAQRRNSRHAVAGVDVVHRQGGVEHHHDVAVRQVEVSGAGDGHRLAARIKHPHQGHRHADSDRALHCPLVVRVIFKRQVRGAIAAIGEVHREIFVGDIFIRLIPGQPDHRPPRRQRPGVTGRLQPGLGEIKPAHVDRAADHADQRHQRCRRNHDRISAPIAQQGAGECCGFRQMLRHQHHCISSRNRGRLRIPTAGLIPQGYDFLNVRPAFCGRCPESVLLASLRPVLQRRWGNRMEGRTCWIMRCWHRARCWPCGRW